MKYKLLVYLFITLLLSGFTYAESSYIFEQDEIANIKTSCFSSSDILCGAGTQCNITIVSPDSSLLVDNGVMTNNNNYYNYSLSELQTANTGIYSSVVECGGTTNAYTTFTFEITPNGEKPTSAQSGLYLGMFGIFVLLFILSILGAVKFENTYAKFGMWHVVYITFVMMLFSMWNISSNFLTSVPFLTNFTWALFRFFFSVYWVFVICSIIWLIFQIRKIKEIQSLIDSGVPHDEAFARTVKRGKNKW